MGYKIVTSKEQKKRWREQYVVGAEVDFTSTTRAGLNEEIERFMKKEKPARITAVDKQLVAEYYKKKWRLTMWFE